MRRFGMGVLFGALFIPYLLYGITLGLAAGLVVGIEQWRDEREVALG